MFSKKFLKPRWSLIMKITDFYYLRPNPNSILIVRIPKREKNLLLNPITWYFFYKSKLHLNITWLIVYTFP